MRRLMFALGLALTLAACVAWLMNYLTSRFLVFGRLKRVVAGRAPGEAPAEPAPVPPPNIT